MSSPRPASPFRPHGGFARDVAARGREALDRASETRFGDQAQWLRAGAAAGFGFGAYGLLLGGVGGAAAWIALAAFGAFLLLVQLGHDAAHGTVSANRAVNRIVLFLTFAIVGVDARLWRDRHIRLHHTLVNLPGTGIDADAVDILRLAPDKPWRWWFRFQPLYGPLLFALGHVSLVWIEDVILLRAAHRTRQRGVATPRAMAGFVGGKLVHFALFLLLPAWALDPSWLALGLGYLLASGVIAICFALLVVGTHVSDLALFPLPDDAGRLPHDWATHQLLTSVDWAPTNRLAVLLSGGANAHVAHHLFPGHHHRHLAMLSRIVAESAAAHGLHHRVTSFPGMIHGQWRHLIALSRPFAAA